MTNSKTITTNIPAFCIAGTHSGVGKTTITLGVLAALRRRGLKVQPFKCGPDYIDPGHHTLAAGRISRNLDTWMMGLETVQCSFARAVQDADVAVAEGVMGLFDSASSTEITGSTAHVSMLLNIPIILVVDAKAMARSVAALVHGFSSFEPNLHIAGVIANKVGSKRHGVILKEALEAAGLPPLLGCIPSSNKWHSEERHLGLVTARESGHTKEWFDALADGIESYVNIDKILLLCNTIKPPATKKTTIYKPAIRLGIASDEAFQFYYEDNLDILRACGVELVEFSPIHDEVLPQNLSGLYIGGGYPELYAEKLSSNISIRKSIKTFADNGGHIYAECGGLMYLCKSLCDQNNKVWDMCNVLSAETIMEKRRRRLGYVEATVILEGLFGEPGTTIRGHEFHWSDVKSVNYSITPFLNAKFTRDNKTMSRGLHYKNVWASYIHLHFGSTPSAVLAWVKQLKEYTS